MKEEKQAIELVGWSSPTSVMVLVGNTLHEVATSTGESHLLYAAEQKPFVGMGNSEILVAHMDGSNLEIGYVAGERFINRTKIHLPGFYHELQDWSYDGMKIFVTSRQGVSIVMYSVEVETGRLEQITDFGHVVMSTYEHPAGAKSFNRIGGVLFPYTGPSLPAELWQSVRGTRRKVSSFNGT